MNNIDKIRKEILQYFNPDNEIIGSDEIFFSPSGHYRVQTKSFKQNKPDSNWNVTKVEVYETINNEIIFSFLVNEDTFFHSWVTKNETEYLLCAEDLCGGQTIIDLSNKKMSSFTTDDDGLIWTKHLLSPDEKLLAVFGCGWGSPFFITVYYFDKPMELPLQIAYEPSWTGYDMTEWIDNNSLRVKESENEEFILELEIHHKT
jgi:hypothetical protein